MYRSEKREVGLLIGELLPVATIREMVADLRGPCRSDCDPAATMTRMPHLDVVKPLGT
jgi:hypothetical protein